MSDNTQCKHTAFTQKLGKNTNRKFLICDYCGVIIWWEPNDIDRTARELR